VAIAQNSKCRCSVLAPEFAARQHLVCVLNWCLLWSDSDLVRTKSSGAEAGYPHSISPPYPKVSFGAYISIGRNSDIVKWSYKYLLRVLK